MKPSAHISYYRKNAEIKSLLRKIEIGLDAHNAQEQTDKRNWGYFGDLGHVKAQLQEVSNFLRHEGDYAE